MLTLVAAMLSLTAAVRPQPGQSGAEGVEVRVRLKIGSGKRIARGDPSGLLSIGTPALVWLDPVEGTPAIPFLPQGPYVLSQKDRVFKPHLLVVPTGSKVTFPNQDPFFHNVFSLFDGKRFDLGLYETGSSKDVLFSRGGVSYIFCNIHPEMSAVVISLSTPLYAMAGKDGTVTLRNVPPGVYRLNVWVEAASPSELAGLRRRVRVSAATLDLGDIDVAAKPVSVLPHENKFGHPYENEPKAPY